MATDRPPPYFPQGSLSPPSESRYLKFRLAVIGVGIVLLALLGAGVTGLVFLLKRIL